LTHGIVKDVIDLRPSESKTKPHPTLLRVGDSLCEATVFGQPVTNRLTENCSFTNRLVFSVNRLANYPKRLSLVSV